MILRILDHAAARFARREAYVVFPDQCDYDESHCVKCHETANTVVVALLDVSRLFSSNKDEVVLTYPCQREHRRLCYEPSLDFRTTAPEQSRDPYRNSLLLSCMSGLLVNIRALETLTAGN